MMASRYRREPKMGAGGDVHRRGRSNVVWLLERWLSRTRAVTDTFGASFTTLVPLSFSAESTVMEAYLETAFVVTSYASLSLTVLASIPTALSIARRLTGQTSPVLRDDLRSVLKPLYVDEDGEATHESLEASSGRWQRIGVLLPTVAGLGASLADAVVSGNEDFLIPFLLQSGVWVDRIWPIQYESISR